MQQEKYYQQQQQAAYYQHQQAYNGKPAKHGGESFTPVSDHSTATHSTGFEGHAHQNQSEYMRQQQLLWEQQQQRRAQRGQAGSSK